MEEKGISKSSFLKKLEEVIGEFGEKKLEMRKRMVEDYCSLTGHDYTRYQAIDRIPAGFLMTFTAPSISSMIISLFNRFPGIIKGVIHTSSKLDFYAPFRLSSRFYNEKIELRGIEEKQGRMGSYFVMDFEVVLADDAGDKVVSDLHQFFLRV
jgi:hypothetical protein